MTASDFKDILRAMLKTSPVIILLSDSDGICVFRPGWIEPIPVSLTYVEPSDFVKAVAVVWARYDCN